jgi:transposase-like protein
MPNRAARWPKSPIAANRFPPVIIQHAVWLYLRFTLSYRDVEELLAERGLDISYETIRCWVVKFGPLIARRLRRCRPRPSNRKKQGFVPKLLVTDKLCSYASAFRRLRLNCPHERGLRSRVDDWRGSVRFARLARGRGL